jgi:hypothetical protein
MSFLQWSGYVEIALCVAVLCFITFRKQWRDYWALGSFLAVRVVSNAALALILRERDSLGTHTAYRTYFYVYWWSFAIQSVLAVLIVYGILRLTTTPLKGLQTLGTKVFLWVAGICMLLAVGLGFAPHMSGTKYLVAAVEQLQRTQSILTLCIALFVFFAIRSMGLSYRSKVFGVSLGLAIMAINDLVQTVWLRFSPEFHSVYNLANSVVICTILAIWAAYFAMREPTRRDIELSPTSPFFRLDRMATGWFG